jgi:hypothetical protein
MVEPYLGTWGLYGAASEVRCLLDEKIATSVAQAGVQRVTLFTAIAELGVNVPAGSRVTLPDGRRGYAGAVAKHDGGGLPTPDHTEIAITVGSEYGPALGGETVEVLHRVADGEDRYHNIKYRTVTTVVTAAAVRPLSSNEKDAGGRAQTVDAIEVVLPPGTEVSANDRLRVRGLVYEVDGTPEAEHDPMTGTEPGVRVVAKRHSG